MRSKCQVLQLFLDICQLLDFGLFVEKRFPLSLKWLRATVGGPYKFLRFAGLPRLDGLGGHAN